MEFGISKQYHRLPDGEEVTMLDFFVLTEYWCMMDGWIYGHFVIAITRASIASRG